MLHTVLDLISRQWICKVNKPVFRWELKKKSLTSDSQLQLLIKITWEVLKKIPKLGPHTRPVVSGSPEVRLVYCISFKTVQVIAVGSLDWDLQARIIGEAASGSKMETRLLH